MPQLPTGTVSFLFTDIEGSTRLWESSAEAMAGAVAQHDALLMGAIADQRGTVFSTSGDGGAAAFVRAQEAVDAALQAQIALAEANWEGAPLRVRMAIHTGEAFERDGNYFGPALNEAGRLLSTAHGGQVVISSATREVMGAKLPAGVDLRDLGEHRLRDVARAIRIFQLVHPGLAADFPPLRTGEPTRSRLPPQVTTLVGRHDELAGIDKLLVESRLLTLVGAGGCGKTRLAVEIASRWQPEMPDTVWFVDLTGVSEPELVLPTVSRALELTEASGTDGLERLLEFLRPKQGLLVIDNCEHVRDSAGSVVAAIVRGAPSMRILATSREALGLQGEVLWEVPPLPIPAVDTPADELQRFDSVRLFESRAAAAFPEFSITSANADAVRRICRRLDGIPLGVELAAARLRVMTLDDLAKRLEASLGVLGSAGQDVVPHHRTIEATLEWSYELLDPTEQDLFRRLAVFAGGWTLEAAEEVSGAAPQGPVAVLDGLSSLVEKSLVVVIRHSTASRYRLLEPVRQYANGKLTASGVADDIRRRHAQYFAHLAETAYPNLIGPDEGTWLDRLEADVDNLREALAWLSESDAPTAQLMAGALQQFWGRTHRDEEAMGWQRRLVPTHATPGTALARTLVLSSLHSLEEAVAHHAKLDQAIELYRIYGPERELILALRVRAGHYDAFGEWPEAVALLEEAVERARALGDAALLTLATSHLAGILTRWAGDLVAAAPLVAESVAAARSLASPVLLHDVLNTAAHFEEGRGDLKAASALLLEALDVERRSASPLGGVGVALTRLAEIAVMEDRLDAALDHLREQSEQIETLGYGDAFTRNPLRRESLRILGEIEVRRGNHATGVTLLAAHAATFAPQRLEKVRQERFDAALASARGVLGDEAATRAWNEGSGLTLEQALRYGEGGLGASAGGGR
ncbi:MAG: adenylate/guanylate cyclase domain-containing protein [Acidimicrobiia bacterium]